MQLVMMLIMFMLPYRPLRFWHFT